MKSDVKLHLDDRDGTASVAGRFVQLTRVEMACLRAFGRDRLITPSELLRELNSASSASAMPSIRATITRLRRKLEVISNGVNIVENVNRHGYRLRLDWIDTGHPQPAVEADRGASYQLYAQAEALAGIGAWQCDVTSGQLSWTPGVYGIFGLSPGSKLRRSKVLDLYHEQSRLELEDIRGKAVRSLGTFKLQVRICTPSGEQRHLQINGAARDHGPGRVLLYGTKQLIWKQR